MELEDLVILIVSGGLAGWLAGMIFRKASLNLAGNIVFGVIGAYVGTSIFRTLGIQIGNIYLETLVSATVGAILLLLALSFLQKKNG